MRIKNRIAAFMLFFAVTVNAQITVVDVGHAAIRHHEQVSESNTPVDKFLSMMMNPFGTERVALSPDGKKLLLLDNYHNLVLKDLETGKLLGIHRTSSASYANSTYWKDAHNIFWITNDLIALDYGVHSESIDLVGKHVANIGDKVLGKVMTGEQESTLLLVNPDYDSEDLALVDARTGKKTRIDMPASGKIKKWAFDGQGQLRAVTLESSGFLDEVPVITNWYKPTGGPSWEKLAESKPMDEYWLPAFLPEKNNSLVVTARGDRDTLGFFEYSINTGKLAPLLAGDAHEDISYADWPDFNRLRSYTTAGMKPMRHWLDSTWEDVQNEVDQRLPESSNVISGDLKGKILVFSYSDVDPGRWFLLDVPTMKLTMIGATRNLIKPSDMRHTQIVSYTSTDGLTIPAYLTQPDDTQGLKPAVVVIPGSPFARGQWGWDMETQLLAKHGYVVLRPQIRGSEGFGKKFHDAGYREWGRAMQDDITNGVNYLIREKIADPNRICIYGTGYGGYVAMWGLVGTPDLYRCAISFGGISDLSQMYDDWLKLSDDKDIKEIRSAWIGDITRDKAQFDAVSPAKHADRIKAPLLIMHGEMDRSIPVSQSKKMMGALDDNHKVYEWVSLPESGNVVRERNLYYKSVLQFLDKYNPPDPARVTSIAKDATTVPGIEKQSVTSIPTH